MNFGEAKSLDFPLPCLEEAVLGQKQLCQPFPFIPLKLLATSKELGLSFMSLSDNSSELNRLL